MWEVDLGTDHRRGTGHWSRQQLLEALGDMRGRPCNECKIADICEEECYAFRFYIQRNQTIKTVMHPHWCADEHNINRSKKKLCVRLGRPKKIGVTI